MSSLQVAGCSLQGRKRIRRVRRAYHTRDFGALERDRRVSGLAMWMECRECEHRELVHGMTRTEMVEKGDRGEIRCRLCGGRMVEG